MAASQSQAAGTRVPPHSPCARTPLRPQQEPPTSCPLSARQTTQLLSPLAGPGTQRGRGCPRAEAGPEWLNRACERRGTFCTVESERSGGGLSGRDAVKSLSAKFGGITIESTKMWVLAPAPAELGPSVVGGGVTRPAWLSRGGFRTLQKVSANPYFNHTTFPPLFAFSALGVQDRAEGARVDSDGSGVSLGCV